MSTLFSLFRWNFGMTSTDQSLVVKVRAGNEEAATEIYERYSDRILGLVKSKMADGLMAQVEPEDIVQSVFKSIFRGVTAGGYDAPEGGTLWQLMAVVAVHKVRRNASIRHAQKRDSRRTEALDAMDCFDPASPINAEEFELAIRESIECLKPTEKEVVLMRVQGFTVEEISDQSGRSRRSIERILHSIRGKLSEQLDIPTEDSPV
jgi:RNA polymerase sigma-70 factor, ECF subfamily